VNNETLISRGNNLIPQAKVGLTCSHTIKPNNMPTDNIFDFLQQSSSSTSDYVKFNDGDKKSFRILAKPVTGYVLFVDGKPQRVKPDNLKELPQKNEKDEKPKTFAAFIVYEYADNGPGSVKLWEVTQKSVINQLAMLFSDQDKHWTDYQLVVTRLGQSLDTKYNVTGIQAPIEETLLAFCAVASKYIDLSKLYTGDNPFIDELPVLEAKQQKSEPNDLPF